MDYTLAFVQQQAVADGTINDNSEWGVGANPARSARANVLLLSKNNKSGTRTYLSVVNTTPLSSITWNFTNTMDGWHQATLLVFNIWDGATAYTADNNAIYYASTAKFYKCIQNNTNVEPDSGSGPDNWTEITDFTLIQQGYTNVDVKDFNFNVKARVAVSLKDNLHALMTDKFLGKLQIEDAASVIETLASLEGAEANFLDDEPDQGEEIMRALEAALD